MRTTANAIVIATTKASNIASVRARAIVSFVANACLRASAIAMSIAQSSSNSLTTADDIRCLVLAGDLEMILNQIRLLMTGKHSLIS